MRKLHAKLRRFPSWVKYKTHVLIHTNPIESWKKRSVVREINGEHVFVHKEFSARRPWVFQFEIDGCKFGGTTPSNNLFAPQLFAQEFPGVKTIMELGSLEGAETIALSRLPSTERVLGLEGRDYNVDKAELVRRLLGISKVTYVVENLENADLTKYGKFDAVYCRGLLYHLPEPWSFIQKLPAVADRLFLDTHFVSDDQADACVDGWDGWYYREFGYEDPQSGLSPQSFWLSRSALLRLLGECGYKHINVLQENPNHVNGARLTLAAWFE